MKRQSMQDERVSAQRRKVNSEAYGILMILLLVSILVQQFLFNAPFKQYAAEFICFFGMSIYMVVRYIMLGLNINGEGKQAKNVSLVISILAGSIVTTLNGIINYTRYAEHYRADGIGFFIATLVVTFMSATVLAFVLLSCANHMNNRKQAKIQKQLDEDEQDV